MLAVDEACTNIIKHAYGYAGNRDIDVEVLTNSTRFEVIITHNGKSFDPSVVKSPDMKEYFRKYQRGGLGIHLMRRLMDEVTYETLPDKRNVVRMIKLLPVNSHRPK